MNMNDPLNESVKALAEIVHSSFGRQANVSANIWKKHTELCTSVQ